MAYRRRFLKTLKVSGRGLRCPALLNATQVAHPTLGPWKTTKIDRYKKKSEATL